MISDLALALDLLTLDVQPPETRQRLLRFWLGTQDSALLPLEQITEILEVDAVDILPVPEMPHCVLGICNWRGEMLWLIDLAALVGYPSPSRSTQQEWLSPLVIVVQANGQSLGLAVQRVDDIELHDLQRLQPATPGLFHPRLLPFVLGILPGEGGVVLDVISMFEGSLWQHHPKGTA